MLGYTEHELISKTVKGISHPDDAHLTDGLRDRLRAGALESFKIEKRYIRKDGTPLWVGLTVATRRDRSGAPLYDVSIVDDISVRKKAEERVEYLATHDSLTGLPNRDVRPAPRAGNRDRQEIRPAPCGSVHRPRPVQDRK
jgi:PAS domain S-box-containing protein